jgi:hypothetical protein
LRAWLGKIPYTLKLLGDRALDGAPANLRLFCFRLQTDDGGRVGLLAFSDGMGAKDRAYEQGV